MCIRDRVTASFTAWEYADTEQAERLISYSQPIHYQVMKDMERDPTMVKTDSITMNDFHTAEADTEIKFDKSMVIVTFLATHTEQDLANVRESSELLTANGFRLPAPII